MLPHTEVSVFAPAKINLSLHVGGKRTDGFHELQSLVVFADVGDALEIARSDKLSLAIEGPFAQSLGGENLITKAVCAFAEATGQAVNVRAVLTKNLPVASGIGGGSADAAATLRALAQLYPGVSDAQMLDIATELGSDVPACFHSRPLIMRGRGEQIELLPLFPPLQAVLVNPGVSVATADVFRSLKTRTGVGGSPPDTSSLAKLLRFLRASRNDLEAPARTIAPVIGEVLDELARMPGIELARVSGSGATCFGLFESKFEAEMAATALRSSHPDWWITPTVLGAV